MKKTSIIEILRGIERPSRYIGDEVGLPAPPSSPRLRVVFGFPDVYEVGMSHLGFRLLHAALLARGDIRVERVFLPWPDLQLRLLREQVPLFTLESQTPVADADLVALSIQYELALPTVLRMLDLAQIPRRTAERARSDRNFPLVLVGGSAALNPEPIAPFIDACFLGEADLAIHEIVEALIDRRASRSDQLARLSLIDGIYIPEWTDARCDPDQPVCIVEPRQEHGHWPVHRRYVANLDDLVLPAVSLLPYCSIVHDRIAIEIQRGCSQGCRFCQAGFTGRPTRQRSSDRVLELARQQLNLTGYEDLSLLSLSAGDHPHLQHLISALIREHGPARVAVSLPSLRTENLDPIVAEHVGHVRKASFTLAPEAATDRLRRVINKGNTEADLLSAVRSLIQAGYNQLKLYFMIGLPTERDEDVIAIADLSESVLQAARGVSRGVNLTVSISTFVPKPHTPFQWEAAPDLQQIDHKQQLLQSRVSRRIRLKWHDRGQSLVESYLARADRRMAAVLDRLVTSDYLGLDAWTDHFHLDRWQQALAAAREAGEIPPPSLWLGPRDPALPLPWDHIDVGVERRYLLQERENALSGRVRPDCSDGTCDQCGVCPEAPLHVVAVRAPAVAVVPEQPLAVAPTDQPLAVAPTDQPLAVAPTDQLLAVQTHLRAWFHKTGRASLLSHLEMMSVFERAVRRASLPVAFSEGYHPKPKLRFAPALPLGAESWCEFVEISLAATLEPLEAFQRLQAQLPAGLALQQIEVADGGPFHRRIRGVLWHVELDGWESLDLEEIRRQLRAGTLRVPRRSGRVLDLGTIVQDLQLTGDGVLEIRCGFDESGTARPSEMLRAMLQLDEASASRAYVLRRSWILSEPATDAKRSEDPA